MVTFGNMLDLHLFADGDDEGQVVELLLVLLLVLHEVGGAHLPHGEADGLQEPAKNYPT